MSKGYLFSQTVMQRPSNQSHCFVSARWHSTDGIIVITTDCQVLLLSNFSLDALAHCLSTSDTSSLLSLRNRIQITFYSFSSYFSSITCMVPVLFCFYSHGQESADTLLLGGIGETALIRVTFQPNRKILRNCVPSSSLHSSGIRSIRSEFMYISVVTMEGNVFLLHGGSFFPVSFSLSSDIESTLFLPPPNPLFLVIQRTESSRQLRTASLSFGSFSLHPAVCSSPEMELILGGKKPLLVAAKPNLHSKTFRLFSLQVASWREQYLGLLFSRQFAAARSLARRFHLDETPIIRGEIEAAMAHWIPANNWLTAPSAPCDAVFAALAQNPHTIGFVAASDHLASAATLEGFLEFVAGKLQDDGSFRELCSRWCAFRVASRGREWGVKMWQNVLSVSLEEFQRRLLARGEVSALRALWGLQSDEWESGLLGEDEWDGVSEGMESEMGDGLIGEMGDGSLNKMGKGSSVDVIKGLEDINGSSQGSSMVITKDSNNQSTDQSTNHSINQSTNHSINQSTTHSTNQSIITISSPPQIHSLHLPSLPLSPSLRRNALTSVASLLLQHRETPGLLPAISLLLHHSDAQETHLFLQGILRFLQREFQSLAQQETSDIPRLITLKRLATLGGSFSPANDPTLTAELLHFRGYLTQFLLLRSRHHLNFPLSPAAQLPSNEELVLQLLDAIPTSSLHSASVAQLAQFCANRNMDVDEVFAYSLQLLIETTGNLDMPRIEAIFSLSRNGDRMTEALRGVSSRSPPYPAELLSLLEVFSTRVTKRSIDQNRGIFRPRTIAGRYSR